MAFDYKKEYKEFYMPKGTPSIVTVPKMNYIAVRGSGNPNDADGEYKQAIGLLYGIAFTIKMSKKEDHQIDGYFDYVVPPLEGFWWQGERRPGDAMLRTDRAGRRDQAPPLKRHSLHTPLNFHIAHHPPKKNIARLHLFRTFAMLQP